MGRVEVKPGPLLAILLLLLLYLMLVARGGGEQTTDKKQNPLKQAKTVKNPHPYSYTLNPGSSVCGDSKVDLLVLVASALKHGDRRSAVRKTWGASNEVDSLIYLLVPICCMSYIRPMSCEEDMGNIAHVPPVAFIGGPSSNR